MNYHCEKCIMELVNSTILSCYYLFHKFGTGRSNHLKNRVLKKGRCNANTKVSRIKRIDLASKYFRCLSSLKISTGRSVLSSCAK